MQWRMISGDVTGISELKFINNWPCQKLKSEMAKFNFELNTRKQKQSEKKELKVYLWIIRAIKLQQFAMINPALPNKWVNTREATRNITLKPNIL